MDVICVKKNLEKYAVVSLMFNSMDMLNFLFFRTNINCFLNLFSKLSMRVKTTKRTPKYSKIILWLKLYLKYKTQATIFITKSQLH